MLKINKFEPRCPAPGNRLGKPFVILLFAIIGLACQSDTGENKAATAESPANAGAEMKINADREYLLGKFDPTSHSGFVPIKTPYADKAGMMLRKEAFEAFEAMWKAAEKEAVLLKIISATRNFARQKDIWENKWKRYEKAVPKPEDRALKILEYSSMPGSSRHHWGTDIDLNDLNNAAFETGGKYEKVYAWLQAHAHEYGFCQPYTAGRASGYQEEKWHWSFTPLSKSLLETYKNTLHDTDISGFMGAETAAEIGIVQHYVLGINEACK